MAFIPACIASLFVAWKVCVIEQDPPSYCVFFDSVRVLTSQLGRPIVNQCLECEARPHAPKWFPSEGQQTSGFTDWPWRPKGSPVVRIFFPIPPFGG